MRNHALLLVATVALAGVGGSAAAQVTGVVTQATAALQFNPGVDFGTGGLLTYTGENITGLSYDGSFSTSQYQVTSNLQPNNIVFANGATATGPYQYSTTTTSIAVTFTNNDPAAVQPKLVSTITPGGFGFYVGNTSGCLPFMTAGCPQSDPATGVTFASLTRDATAPTGTDLGGATFTFTISSGSTVLENLTGSLTLFYNPANPTSPIVVSNLGALAATLSNFGLETPVGSPSAIGYNWQATPLLVTDPTIVAPGGSDTLTYTTTVASYSRSDCALNCELVGYGGFGDPIGLSGGSGGKNARIGGLSSLGFAPAGGNGLIQGVNYQQFYYGLPTFEDGNLVLPLETVSVPEPAAWALMLLGTVALGGRLRGRRAARVYRA